MKLGHPTGSVDLTDWELPEMEDALDALKQAALTTATEAVKYALENSAFAYFAADDDGPLKLFVSIEMGSERIEWAIDIEDAALINDDAVEPVARAFEKLAKSLKC